MKEKIKKILKIALLVIIAIVILYNLMFDTAIMTREEELKFREKYDGFVLFSSRDPSWYLEKFQPFETIYVTFLFNKSPLIGVSGGNGRYLVFFRWKKSELVKQLESEIIGELDEFKQSGYIKDYICDKETMHLDIFMDKDKHWEAYKYIEYEWQNDKLETLRELREVSAHVEVHEVGTNVEEPEIVTKEYVYDEQETEEDNKKSAYNEKEINCLEKILSRSKNKKVFDYNDDWKIRGYEDGENIWYLDLSDYSDITGRLDLSDFTELKYVELKGMKIDSVVLPESLESIDPNTFNNCKNLTEITIPKSVTSFSNLVFSGCKNLKEIVFEGDAPEVSWENEDIFEKVPEDLIIYRKKSAKGWQEKCWDKYDVRIIEE